ncbi:hypothetical protein CGGC5_v017013 [Colletotrichum fructicola Nara gc5]|uniref:Uncharacterized protein n=1 Tax=Colletotrichum fructicola (strain Nara gc5) TaxID=1213859 RepID=A0A7J6IEA4_COLFN|nr:hypothetical protein CGGC5_v017013 [Colletotrichum fructicola Nara gc5]KAF4881164.1 hypothetical protein CGCFRS4_v015834 [Colletotrichum fructicola]
MDNKNFEAFTLTDEVCRLAEDSEAVLVTEKPFPVGLDEHGVWAAAKGQVFQWCAPLGDVCTMRETLKSLLRCGYVGRAAQTFSFQSAVFKPPLNSQPETTKTWRDGKHGACRLGTKCARASQYAP